ncbi:MAG: hypothetical protein ACHQEB_07275 [Chitinophagales bacterium]
MKKHILSLILIILSACTCLRAQDTLPKFSIKNAGNNRIIISWTNNFKIIKQISIQRSFDSLTGYKSILTVPDPTTPQNGYLDTKGTNDHMFYRLYILLDKGVYMFSEAKKPLIDTLNKQAKIADTVKRLFRIDVGGKIELIPGVDSIAALNEALKNKNKPDIFVPSIYVSAYKNGYVHVSLPDAEKKYSIKFFEDDGTFLFELKDIKEKKFNIDKSNFYHAGWFGFELYGDGKLIEKHKFYLEKEF